MISSRGAQLQHDLLQVSRPARREIKRRSLLAAGQAVFRAWTLTADGRANQRRLKGLRNAYVGRRCFVMGNGPSLLRCDLKRLAHEITIVSNANYLMWDQLDYIPTFLTVEDALTAEDRASDLQSLRGCVRIFPFDLRHFLGDSGETLIYLNLLRNYAPFPKFSWDIAHHAYWGGTVSFLNLQIAAFLGCNPIVLVGFDHSYVVPSSETDNTVIRSYDADVNHFSPDYLGPGQRWYAPNVPRMEAAYRHARGELEQTGYKVLNATPGGHLEIFERVSFDSVL